MPYGSLDHVLFGGDAAHLDWGRLHRIAVGTAKGIAYLHEECEQKIIHHDIKPGNVLLDENYKPKVGDFGLARLSNPDNTHVVMSGFKGTPGYAAPEVWTSYVSHKCDVYSFGMLLFEIVGRRRNHVGGELSGTSKEWLPRWVYEKAVERKEVGELLAELGVIDGGSAEESERAERAVMVGLWCVQYLPTARPNMSDVVRMLEGGAGIPQPPNPFAHLVDAGGIGVGSTTWGSSTDTEAMNQTFPLMYEKRIDILAAANATL